MRELLSGKFSKFGRGGGVLLQVSHANHRVPFIGGSIAKTTTISKERDN